MDLQRNDSAPWNSFIALRVINRLHAVQPKLNVRALRANPIVVPFARSERLVPRLLFRLHEIPVSPAFIIQISVRIRAEIGLVTRHLEIVRHALRPELDAAVHKSVGSFQPVLKSQIEVPEFPPRRQKFVVRLFALDPAGHDGPVLHAPVIRIAFPAVEGLSVKKRDRLAGEGPAEPLSHDAFTLLRSLKIGSTPVAFARAVGRADEKLTLTNLRDADPGIADMATLVMIGSSETRWVAREGTRPWMLTPRSYGTGR